MDGQIFLLACFKYTNFLMTLVLAILARTSVDKPKVHYVFDLKWIAIFLFWYKVINNLLTRRI
ncbi:hypothetical protein C8I07_14430 [Shewanella baltica]|nr:hypothetical protein C8I07_14430 [Shewanella baltica]